METAKYTLELMPNGKFKIEVDWDNLSNMQLRSFLNNIVAPPDSLVKEAKKRIAEAAEPKEQVKLIESFLTNNTTKRSQKKQPIFKPSNLIHHHFHDSHGYLGGEDE